ncbi:MAG: DUF6067 family protein [Armatimonadota bacterium]|nr:DUF6067 family protein [Armatimonadota bacterium]
MVLMSKKASLKEIRLGFAVAIAALLVNWAFANTVYWRPYEPDANTYAFWRFDGTIQDLSKFAHHSELKGDVQFALGKFGQGLSFGEKGGSLIVKLTQPPTFQHALSFEAWVLVKKLPKDEAVIVERVWEDGKVGGFSLRITSDGRAKFSWRNLTWKVETVLTSPPNSIPIGQWTHIAGSAPFSHFVGHGFLFVNGKQVAGVNVQMVNSPQVGSESGTLVIGNDLLGNAPLYGVIDELRIQGEVFAYYEQPDNSWTDVKKQRTVAKGKPFLPDEKRILFYASFDGFAEAEIGANRKPLQVKDVRFVDGVRGQAILGTVSFATAGNLNFERGALEFWFQPQSWDNKNYFNVPFFSGIGTIYAFNRGVPAWYPTPISFFVPKPEGGWDFVNAHVSVAPEEWHHVVVNWYRNTVTIFLDGKRYERKETKTGLTKSNEITFGISPTAIDEVYIYDRPLTEKEVANAYWRYRDDKKLQPAPPMEFSATYFFGLNRLVLNVEFFALDKPEQVAKAQFELLSQKKVIWQTETKQFYDGVWTELIADLPKLAEGKYTIRAMLKDAKGKTIAQDERTFERKKAPEWLNNKIGEDEIVLPPWRPIQVKGNSVSVWGRQIAIGADGLPEQISSGAEKQLPLLSRPIAIEGVVNGKPLRLKVLGLKWLKQNDAVVEYSALAKGDGLKTAIKGRLEYDGFLLLQLQLVPQGKVTIQRLALVIPMRVQEAKDFYALAALEGLEFRTGEIGQNDGVIWDSKNGGFFTRHGDWRDEKQIVKQSAMTVGSFIPFIWVGNGERGICWMAENDKGWMPNNEVPAVVLERKGDEVLLQFNFIGVPSAISEPRTITFSLMATPVKPFPKEGRRWVYEGSEYGTSGIFVFEDHRYSGRVYEDGAVLLEPFPVDWEKSRQYAEKAHKAGQKYLPYQEFTSFTARIPERELFASDWDGVFPMDSLNDFRLYWLREWVKRCDVDGTYIDNVYPRPSFNVGLGSAYRLPDGRIQPGFHFLGMRSYIKRLRTMLHQMGKTEPCIVVHMTHTMLIPCYSFADIALDGEAKYIGPRAKDDFIDRWLPLHAVRVGRDGHRWGIVVTFLPPTGPWSGSDAPEVYRRAHRTASALLLLHDIHRLPPPWDEIADQKPRQALLDWGITSPDVTFHPYWRERDAIVCQPENVKASYWRLGERVCIVVTNIGNSETIANLDLSALKLKSPTFVDAETGEDLVVKDYKFQLFIKGHDFRLIVSKSE